MRSPTVSRLYVQVEPRRRTSPLGRMHASGRNCSFAPRPSTARFHVPEGPSSAEGHHAHAELRRRADAIRPALPRRRRGAHRAADRGEGDEPCGRPICATWTEAGGLLSHRGDRSSRTVLGTLPLACVEGAAVLVVDDDHAPPRPWRLALRPAAAARRTRVCREFRGGDEVARRELRRAAVPTIPGPVH